MNRDNLIIAPDHPTPNPDQNAALNPTVELTRVNEENMEEYVRRHSEIGLDWYVPDLNNTRKIDLIKTRLAVKMGKAGYYSTTLSYETSSQYQTLR